MKLSPGHLSKKGKIGLTIAVLGVAFQVAGYIFIKFQDFIPQEKFIVLVVLTLGLGTPCLFLGLVLLAVSKGRSGLWGVLGFLPFVAGVLALIGLLTLPEKIEKSLDEERGKDQGLERRETIKLGFFFIVFITASFILSFKKGAFAAGALVVFPAMIYFVAKGIEYIKRPLALGLCIVGFSGVWVPLVMDGIRMGELAGERKAAVREIRPVIMEYREDHGHFPEKLEDLVPDYISEIPPTLIYNEQDEYYHRVEYYAPGAYFRFYNFRGPDSGVTYDIKKDEFEYDT